MIPRQAVQAAFRFEETETVPHWLQMEPAVRDRLAEHYGSPTWDEGLTTYVAGWHTIRQEQRPDGAWRDPFGAAFEPGSICRLVDHALPEPSLDGYAWPDPETIIDWKGLEEAFSPFGDAFRLSGLAWGLFERAWTLRGMENFLMDMVADENFTNELLDGILDIHLRTMDAMVKRIPLDAYFGGDDWADQRGPMMGVELWRKYIKPPLARLVGRAHEHGLPYVLHSCGNVLPLIDDLMEIGLDALESLQPEAMDVYELKRRVAGRMVLIGGLGVQSTLPFGTPDDVRNETQRLMRELGKGGGYVFAPAKPLMPDVPTANAASLVEAVRESGRTSS